MKKDCLLDVDDLQVDFFSGDSVYHAVRGVSFRLYPGETVALVGESGCGKSALVQSLIGLLPPKIARTQARHVLLGGKDLLDIRPQELCRIRGRQIGMIFQSLSALNPTMKVGKQIAEILQLHLRQNKKLARRNAIELMRLVGIAEPEKRASQYPHEFSGGMRQRISLAMAIACEPQILLADEPTTALDVTVQAQIMALLREIQKRMGMTIFLITHDLGVVAELCDRMLVMYAGKIVEEGSCARVFLTPQHPYTHALLQSLPRMDRPKQKSLQIIPGQPPSLSAPPPGCPFFLRCPYAMQICREKMPPLQPVAEGKVACWLSDKKASLSRHRFEQDKDKDESR